MLMRTKFGVLAAKSEELRAKKRRLKKRMDALKRQRRSHLARGAEAMGISALPVLKPGHVWSLRESCHGCFLDNGSALRKSLKINGWELKKNELFSCPEKLS